MAIVSKPSRRCADHVLKTFIRLIAIDGASKKMVAAEGRDEIRYRVRWTPGAVAGVW